jgi:class 3 adenylate cyclase
MAMAMRETAGTLIAAWRRRGRVLGFGAGIAQGYATLGQIGFADRSGYTAIGTVCNLAARLCAEVKDGQILPGAPSVRRRALRRASTEARIVVNLRLLSNAKRRRPVEGRRRL